MDSGLVLYLSRSQDMVGGRSQNCLPAGITASFLLQGQAEVVIANQRLQMDSRRDGSPAMLVHLREEEAFQRHWQAGREETKVSLHLGQDWLSRQLDGIASAGLTRLPSAKVRPPRIAESPVALECVTYQLVPAGEHTIVLGRVVAVHIADDCVLDAAKCYVDTPKMNLVGRMHGRGW
ncbi:MAG: hypothetical protein DI592_12170, partial [Stenotrophomonas maltophilia]